MSKSQICEFYQSLNVFVTGGTGFMGKLLIEKLLRSTDVAKIYILIRKKKEKDFVERLDELFGNEIFDKLREQNPKFRNRVVAIAGDINTTNLGLSATDSEELILNVNVIFHLAATIRFTENLKDSYNMNVEGTRSVLMLSKQMKNLKSFVHVSTAFTNCNINYLDEIFYDSVNYEEIKNRMETMSTQEICELTESILQAWPTTYNFTKTLAESLIKNTAEDLPIGIFRPSIVTSTYKEPIEGWIEGFNGATFITAGGAMGVIRVVPCNRNLFADLVPADMSIAALIASAWDVNKQRAERNIPIYNYVSSTDNPLTWKEYHELTAIQYLDQLPLSKGSLLPNLTLTSNLSVYWFLSSIFHCVRAALMDLCLLICFKKPQMLSTSRKIENFMTITKYVCLTKRAYVTKNVKNMWSEMNKEDKKLFPFNLEKLHWLHFFRNYFKGMRLYLFKDPLYTLPTAKMKLKLFKTALYTLSLLIYSVGIYKIFLVLLALK